MKRLRPVLALAASTTLLAATAFAQEDYPQDYPPPGSQPPQGAPPPSVAPQPGEAPPPGYAPPPENVPPPPPATSAGGFGAVSQIAISNDLQMVALRHSESLVGASMKRTVVTVAPAIDYFVASGLSVGGQVLIGFVSDDAQDSTTIGLAPRIGYNIPIGPTASIWPRAGIAYTHTSESPTGGGTSIPSYKVTLFAFVPVIFQPAPHFFIGGGPFLSTDLVSQRNMADYYKSSEFGLQATLGGYFGGM